MRRSHGGSVRVLNWQQICGWGPRGNCLVNPAPATDVPAADSAISGLQAQVTGTAGGRPVGQGRRHHLGKRPGGAAAAGADIRRTLVFFPADELLFGMAVMRAHQALEERARGTPGPDSTGC